MTVLLERLRAALAGRFQVERELGRGGMATVYRARDPKHDREVALKVLHPELASAIHAERFFREIRIAARLNHPNILPLLDSGEADGLLYYVMPLLTGETLRTRLERQGQLGIPESLRIARQVAAALGHAHRQGVIHRDIKPENILLQDGEALVADFGIAYAVSGAGERLTESGLSIGTPQYMSPEQATGHGMLDARSDVYALACLVYEMLAGETPFTGPTAQAIIAKLMTERPVRLRTVRDTVPAAVDEAVAQGLAKVPADRFDSVEDFAAALAAPPPKPRRWTRRHATMAAAGLAAIVAAGVIGKYALRKGHLATAPTAPVLRQITFTGDANDVALSPDGKSIAYLADSLTSLVVQDLSGGGRVTIARARDTGMLAAPRWSPDGTQILYGNGALCYCLTSPGPQLFVVPRLGGPPRVMSLPADVSMASYSAFDFGGSDTTLLVVFTTAHGRKKWIYLGSDPGTIRVIGDDSVVAGGDVVRLESPFDGDAVVGRIRPSPDGRWLAVSGFGARQVIATLPLKAPRPRLTIVDSVSTGIASGLEWAPRGDALYFTRIEGSGGAVLRLDIDRKTGASRRAARPVQGGVSAPSILGISADGRRLAVLTGLDRAHLTLVQLAPPGGGPAKVTPIPCGTAVCVMGTISPDRHRLAFVKNGTGVMDTFDLEVGAIDGSGAERLSGGLGWGPPPIWSPDGRQVLYWDLRNLPDSSRLLAFDLTSRQPRVLWRGITPYWPRISLAARDGRPTFRSGKGLVVLADTVETVLSTDTAIGSPTVSPAGGRVAYADDAVEGGVGVLDLKHGTRSTIVRDPALVPIGWRDDSSLYVVRIDTALDRPRALELLRLRGGPGKVLGTFPRGGTYSRCDLAYFTMSPDWRTAVCYDTEPNTDIWLVEGFDAANR